MFTKEWVVFLGSIVTGLSADATLCLNVLDIIIHGHSLWQNRSQATKPKTVTTVSITDRIFDIIFYIKLCAQCPWPLKNSSNDRSIVSHVIILIGLWSCDVRWQMLYCTVWVNPPPAVFWNFFPKRLGIFNQFFRDLLYDHFYTRLQIFIQISPTLTKLCHTKHDDLANFHISLELTLLRLLTEQMTSLLTSCHIPHVCWHYKSVIL